MTTPGRVGAAAMAVLLPLTLGGCGDSVFGLDSDGAQFVRLALTVPESQEPGQVTYVASNDFTIFISQDGRFTLDMASSDTVTATLPIDETFPTGVTQQLVFVVLDRSAVPETIQLNGWLDQDLRVQSTHPADGEPVRFLYMFQSGVVVDDFDLL
jgi:hypothetical protein